MWGDILIPRIESHISETKTERDGLLDSSRRLVTMKNVFSFFINHKRWHFDLRVLICALQVRNRSNHQQDIQYELSGPKTARNDIMCSIVVRTIEKLVFKIAKQIAIIYESLYSDRNTLNTHLGNNYKCIHGMWFTNDAGVFINSK